ncbi:MAG TPA: toxin-antitoxin system YwqK family antitoxin [Flavobacteriales bacterium]|nr:toxin-antitoxin system YwqK family antitoxin [Flavobacteriales bacterium]
MSHKLLAIEMKLVTLIISFILIGSIHNFTAGINFYQADNIDSKDTINKVDVNNLKQGFWIIYGRDKKAPNYKEDQKIEEGTYLDNRKTGVWKKYFANGKLQNEITYQNSRPNGFAKLYYENGQLKEEGLWKGNKWIGEYKLYHENGNLYHEFEFNKVGKREGVQKYYHENGKIMIEGEWAMGKESGYLKEYYEDGSIKAEKNFANGTLDVATVKEYKKPEHIVDKKPVEPSGSGVTVDKTEVSRSAKKFDGNGPYTLYNMDRQISKDGIFKKNKLMDGKWYKYNRDGILTRIKVFKNGSYVGDAPMPTD